MYKVFLAVALAILAGACATITRGQTQTLGVSTPGVHGAECTLTSSAIGSRVLLTPGTVNVEKSKEDIAVRCTKQCYLEGAGVIKSSVQAMTAGNILVGGVIGLGVDAASGAMNEYQSDIQVRMEPDPKCQPAKPAPRRS